MSPNLRLLSTFDFSLVTETIVCCVRIVTLFLRFAAFEASFVSVSLLMFLTLTSWHRLLSSCPAVGPLFHFLSACCWHCSSASCRTALSRSGCSLHSLCRSPFTSRVLIVLLVLLSRCFVRDFSVWCVPPAPCCGSKQRRDFPVVSPALLCRTLLRRSRWSGASAVVYHNLFS